MDLPTDSINEDSTSYLEVSFLTSGNSPAAPLSASYSIWCLTNNQEITARTEIASPDAVETITISQDENAMLDRRHPYETRRVTVIAAYGLDDKFVQTFVYDVRRVRGLTEESP